MVGVVGWMTGCPIVHWHLMRVQWHADGERSAAILSRKNWSHLVQRGAPKAFLDISYLVSRLKTGFSKLLPEVKDM